MIYSEYRPHSHLAKHVQLIWIFEMDQPVFFGPPERIVADGIVEAVFHYGTPFLMAFGDALEERIVLAPNNRLRAAIVEEFLLGHLQDGEDLAPWVGYVRAHDGRLSLGEITRELGVSERQLERKLKAALGMSPKRLVRITRFLRACGLLREKRFESLTELAHHCGYYDQAHFIHDFREFSGLTPGEFAAEDGVSFLEWG